MIVCSFGWDVQSWSSRFKDVMESKSALWVRAASWGDGGFWKQGQFFQPPKSLKGHLLTISPECLCSFFFFLLCNLHNHLSRTRQDYGTKAIKYTLKNALWLKLCLLIVLLSTVQRFIDLKQTLSVWESFIRLQSDQIRHCGDDVGHFKWSPASLATMFLC